MNLLKINRTLLVTDLWGFHYVNGHSIDKTAMKDLDVSMKQCIVGSNKANAKIGDFCTISVCDNGNWHFAFAIITDKLDTCTEWYDRGGKIWRYNFRIKLLTPLISLRSSIDEYNFLVRTCSDLGLDMNKMFNTFLGYKKNDFRPLWKRFFKTFNYRSQKLKLFHKL
jgi:hypothetical protein